ncbi:YfhO family protein [Candidatus Gottesmanbacteria bacterium]|nr:YfhO family protein [Candidatus Gottesmanbacteria bacterium]
MKTIVAKHWPIVTLFVVWIIFSYPYFFKGLVPFPSRNLVDFFAPWSGFYGMPVKNQAMPDVITQLYPWKKVTIDSWKMFQVPAWNPYQFAGYPLLANVQSAVWTPMNLLFFILPFLEAWSLLVLFQPIAAAIGMYLFIRSLNVSRVGSVLSGLSFMFCGFITVWMAYGTLGYAALTLPWILWSLTRNRMLVTSALVAFSFFSGHIQTSFYVVGASVFFALARRKNITRALLSILLGIGIATPQIIPTIRFYEQSVRSGLFQKLEVIPWNYFPTLIAPDILGNPVTRNDWFGHYAEWASFAGVIPLVLAIFVLTAPMRKPRIVWYFVLLSIVSMLLAFQTPILDSVVSLRIPVLSTSAVSRIIVLLSFSIAALSGFSIDTLQKVWKEKGLGSIVWCGIVWLFVLSVIWGMILRGNLFWIADADAEKLAVAGRNFILPSLLIIFALAMMLMGFSKWKKLRTAILVGMVVVTAFDMLRFATKWMPFEEREFVYPKLPVLSYLSKERGFERVFGNFGNEGQSVFGLYGIEGYDPLYVRRYGELISSSGDGKTGNLTRTTVLIGRQGIHTKRILDLLSVKLILYAKGDGRNVWAFPHWNYSDISSSPIYSDEQYEVYRNEGALSRVYFVPSFIIARSDQEILNRLLSESTDVRSTVVLEEEPAAFEKASDDQEIFERIRIEKYTPNEITISAETNRPGFLVLTDPYYPGWSAYVNGKSTKIYRANFALRAIVVPEGASQVRFVYDHWFL